MSVSPWKGRHLPITLGVFSLTFLFAFEAIAVTTVMPTIAKALDGLSWYSVSFAAPTAAGLVATVIAGQWCDRAGSRPALNAGLAIFIVGLLIAGLAPNIAVFLIGRATHGFGAGLLGVAVYVIVAQAYPEQLRPRIFMILSAGWVLPALIGPVIVGHVADWFSWRWVFLGVPLLAVAAWLLVIGTPSTPAEKPERSRPPLAAAIGAAVGVFAISIGGQRGVWGWPVLVAAGVVAVGFAAARILPAGTWTGGRGLPAILTMRSSMWAGFVCVEAYFPLLLTLERDLSVSQAGLTLTVSSISWFVGSWLASHVGFLHARPHTTLKIGIACGVVGLVLVTTAGTSSVPLALPIVGWSIATLGVGLVFPTSSVIALGSVPPDEAGRASSALQLNDSLSQSVMLALGGILFAAMTETHPVGGATLLVAISAVAMAVAWLPAQRTRTIADRL
jgi:MFS family permease